METSITKLLKIKYPLIQGGMAWISDGNLAAAVSNAGGAGIIAAGSHDSEWLKKEIRKARALTNKPFGVNIMLMSPFKEEIVETVCSEKVDFVTLGAGNPTPYFGRFDEVGIVKIPVVPSLRLALRVQKSGADAIIVEGMEAGGHIGYLTTMSLLSNIPPYIDIPVIAAGGIVDGRGVKAALAMGASGVQMGTRFIASEESPAHINFKEMLVNAKDTDTTIIGDIRGHRVRALKNKFTLEYGKMEREVVDLSELEGMMKGRAKIAVIEGDIDNGLFFAGQSLTMIDKIISCEDIIDRIVAGL
ncbi:MAG TPA: enoyl-[acyl-carrier-protein] reductase FabK [Thermoanaerobacterales bacterium]|nr:enoyl-[acyl-carrier-protein] reductase FabK [Thermoanaerobacterales bacterium]